MGNRAVIRLAEPADVPDIARVNIRTWQVAYRGHVPDSYLDALDPEQAVSSWSKVVLDPKNVVHVGFVAQALVGFCMQLAARDADAHSAVAEIVALYVDPASWRAGVGRGLIEAAVESAQRRQFTELTLWVIAGNAAARRFYEACGFALDGHEKTAQSFGFALHELRYRRSIGDRRLS